MKVCTKLTCFRLDLNGEAIARPTSRLTLLSIGVVLNGLNICVASGFCFFLFFIMLLNGVLAWTSSTRTSLLSLGNDSGYYFSLFIL